MWREIRGKADLEDTQCQELHVLSQSFQAAVEALWSWGFSIRGLVDMAGGKQMQRSSSVGLILLGSAWDHAQSRLWSYSFRVFGARLCLHEKYQLFTSCGSRNHWTGPVWVLGASSSEGLSSAHFAYRWLQWGMRLLGFIPVFAEWCTSPLLGTSLLCC